MCVNRKEGGEVGQQSGVDNKLLLTGSSMCLLESRVEKLDCRTAET